MPGKVLLEPRISNRSAEPALYATCRLYIEQGLRVQLYPNRNWSSLESTELLWNNKDRIGFQVFRHPWSVPERHPILEGEQYQLDSLEVNIEVDYRHITEVRRYNIGWELRAPKTVPKLQGLKFTVDHTGPRVEKHSFALTKL